MSDLAAWRAAHPEDADVPDEVIERTMVFQYFAAGRALRALGRAVLDAFLDMRR